MNEAMLSQLYLSDTAFQELMQERIYNVLLVASTYDAFIMEEDGRVEEQIYLEYVSLNLSSPPRVSRVSNYEQAMQALGRTHFDLIIAMPGVDLSETFDKAKEIKELYPGLPFVVLTPFSREVTRRISAEDHSGVDYVFSWLGNVDLLVAIIKLLEDKMNARRDVEHVGVQLILLVEDSVRFYSSVLPTLYKFLLEQSHIFSTEALNAHERMMRMRGRPKVMLARSYEEAAEIYDCYHDKMLGVISDVSFHRDGAKDRHAGLHLASMMRERDPYLPIIIESSETANAARVADFGGVFLDKNSKKLPVDLGQAITDNFGFGDFVIHDPQSQKEIMRIRDLQDLQHRLYDIPDDALLYHAQRNDISRWLYSRALFPIAKVVKMHRFASIDEAPAARKLFMDLIVKYRKMKNRGVVAEFAKERFDRYSNFARIGDGSLGGKGRGLAFIDAIIKRNPVCDNYDGVPIAIPRTVVICTDVFDRFMQANNLYPLALSTADDADILEAFLKARLPDHIYEDLKAVIEVSRKPLAVRSSSLLEDSHYQPFAGVYATYMIPFLPDKAVMLRQLTDAVKAVYASVFYADSKAYMNATSNVIDQEKMAVIIQSVVGEQHGDYYYPSFSGVGRSLNYYPLGNERATDGVVELAAGLGSYIVDGGLALRFSPRHPKKVLQTSTLDLALRDTQRSLNALRTTYTYDPATGGEQVESIDVQAEANKGNLRYVVSTYDAANARIVDTDAANGRKIVTFANVLRHNVLPLAGAVDFMLKLGEEQMGRPVEIEFAGNINMGTAAGGNDDEPRKGEIYWLQIRPMIDRREMLDEKVMASKPEETLVASHKALGHGMLDNVTGVVLVKPDAFSFENNRAIAAEIEKINCNFTGFLEQYVLIGPGRWGSSDISLGIPVRWSSISSARVVVELSLRGQRIEPSQGTHFFQNLTSMGVAYFTVGSPGDGSWLNSEWLDSAKPCYESEYIKVIRLQKPLAIAVNGQKGEGVVRLPEKDNGTRDERLEMQ